MGHRRVQGLGPLRRLSACDLQATLTEIVIASQH